MKRFILLFCLLLTSVQMVNAQNYDQKRCPNCNGNGRVFSGYYDLYGYPIISVCQNCMGFGFILVPVCTPNFKANRTVSLRSLHGGVTYGYGTFYEGRMQVVYNNSTLNVSYSDSRKWKYMILWSNGNKWYFD